MLSEEEKKARKSVYNKAYHIKNVEKKKAYDKAYREDNIEKCKKKETIGNWKTKGLICDDYDNLYELYLQSTNCEECDCKYSDFGDGVGRWRCMDHCHTTGLFRNFLCNTCNLRRG